MTFKLHNWRLWLSRVFTRVFIRHLHLSIFKAFNRVYIEHFPAGQILGVVSLLQSAVGMAHVLRSGLVMGYTTSYFPLIVLGSLDYTQKSTRSTLALEPSVSPPFYPWVTATLDTQHLYPPLCAIEIEGMFFQHSQKGYPGYSFVFGCYVHLFFIFAKVYEG